MTASTTATATATTTIPGTARDALPRRSPRAFAWFRWYVRRYMARRFHAVRLARAGFQPAADRLDGPVLVVMNHPSWWDPMLGLVLSERFGDRVHAAPIDAAALRQYAFFERLGFFGIEPGTARGAREFLRRGRAILADPRAVLWVTGQGTFADIRERPLRLRDGVGHLAARLDRGVTLLPLALEYAFWDESRPEAFVRFGPPLALPNTGARAPADWTEQIRRALEATQDALAADVRSRNPARFDLLLAGAAGIGGVYDLWRRLKAAVRGEPFDPRHSTPPRGPA